MKPHDYREASTKSTVTWLDSDSVTGDRAANSDGLTLFFLMSS